MSKISVRTIRTAFATVMLLALILAGPLTPLQALAQSDEDLVASATSTTTELSRTWERGAFFDLYDRMHPDARNAIPRQAFFAWAEGDAGIPADDPVDVVVEIGEWTLPLTGETYEEAATITYRQQVERDGAVTEEERSLVLVREGMRWRWFPNLDQATIDTLVDGVEVTERESNYQPAFRKAAYVRIDRFWNGVFELADLTYEGVDDIVAVTEPIDTGCGPEDNIEEQAIYYCTADETVYYDPGFRENVVDISGSYGFTMIVSHEWGHHVQVMLGVTISHDPELDEGLYPIEFELQADCLAGVYAQDALANGEIGWDEIEDAITITGAAGDRPSTDWDDIDAHGTGDQRVESFMTGFEDGFLGCNVDLPA
jgi:predicted metalloprotease